MTTPVSERRAWLALYALCVGLFVTLLDQSFVAVALPAIQREFAASIGQTVWVSAVYLLTFAVPLLITGRLGDHFGQRNVYLAGMSIFTLAAAACAFAPTIETLIVLRAMQGLGASLCNPQPLAIINRIFDKYRRGAATGLWSAVAGSSTLFGPVFGGLIVGTLGWRWMFGAYVPLGLLCLLAVARWVPRLPTRPVTIDISSAILSVLAVSSIIVALQEAPDNVRAWWMWALAVGGVLAMWLFLRRQRKLKASPAQALMPVQLWESLNFPRGITAVFTSGFAIYSLQIPVMIYLQNVHGISAQAAGLMMIPMGLVSILIAPLAGRLSDRLAPGHISTVGFSALIAALSTCIAVMVFKAGSGWILLPLVMVGIANGLIWSPNSAITMRSLPTSLVGAGSGVYNTSRQIGAVVGTAMAGMILQASPGVIPSHASAALALSASVLALGVGLEAVRGYRAEAP